MPELDREAGLLASESFWAVFHLLDGELGGEIAGAAAKAAEDAVRAKLLEFPDLHDVDGR